MHPGSERFRLDMFAGDRRRWRLGALLLATALGASACGSTQTSSTPTLATTATTSASTAIPFSEAPTTIAPSTTAPAATESTTSTTEAALNVFPDIDVLNIADGATVNLAAELGGGDAATLLWFFAPH